MSIIVAGQIVPTPAQIALDIELFYAHLETLDRSDTKGQGVCRSEAMQRSDLYKRCARNQYHRIPEVKQKEKLFLIDFFHAMRGHNFKCKFGWVGQKKTISKPELRVLAAHGSQFYGVHARGERVEGIDLSGNGCRGTLPSSIGQLGGCQFLKLNWNRISGSMPKTMSKMNQLEELELFCNSLEGSLDFNTVESLANLRVLNLSFNKLTGSLPDAFGSSVHLTEINLAGNKLTGELPDSMRNLENLSILKLYNNEFNGEIPTWLGQLQNLEDVNLSQNKFKGRLDPFLQCLRLRHLIVSHNHIEGTISTDISMLSSLVVFYASYNKLTGSIPRSLCSLVGLKKLNLSNNNLSGPLPPAFGDLINLEICILGCNLLCGPAPLSISKLESLKDFELFTQAPSETVYVARAFDSHAFQRIYGWGPSVCLDNVHWEDEHAEEEVALSVEVLETASEKNPETSNNQEEVFSPSISRWLGEKNSA